MVQAAVKIYPVHPDSFFCCSTSTRMEHLSGSRVVADYLNCCNLWDGAVKKKKKLTRLQLVVRDKQGV